jgi:hypothetical protein
VRGYVSYLKSSNWHLTQLVLRVDQPSGVYCQTCGDPYCEVCFAAQHRKGSRKTHIFTPLHSKKESTTTENGVNPAVETDNVAAGGDELVCAFFFKNPS